MALRTRVSNRKFGGRRNKNPKLSPFQREQKRDRLANQPPTVSNKASARDYPKHARELVEYLEKRKEREAAQKAKKEAAKAAKRNGGQAPAAAPTAESVSEPSHAEAPSAPEPAVVKVKKSKNKFAPAVQEPRDGKPKLVANTKTPQGESVFSLNHEINDSRTVMRYDEEKMASIMRKKQKKHLKKKAAKMEANAEKVRKLEERLKEEQESAGTKRKRLEKKKAAEDPVEAETRRLEKLQAEHAKEVEVERAVKAEEARQKAIAIANGEIEENIEPSGEKKRKRITFDESVEAPGEGEHQPMRFPHDNRRSLEKSKERIDGFEERVDYVRFGERVDAPPVFDSVPQANSFNEKGQKLLEEAGIIPADQGGIQFGAAKKKNRLAGVTQQKGQQAGLYEHKKLVKLGLVKAATQAAPLPENEENVAARDKIQLTAKEKAGEMELLRNQVMNSYRKGKSKSGHGSTLFKHAFPASQ